MQGDRYDGLNCLEAFSAAAVVVVLHAPLQLKAMAFDNIVVPSRRSCMLLLLDHLWPENDPWPAKRLGGK